MKELANLMVMLTVIIIGCIGFSTTKAKTIWSIMLAIETVFMLIYWSMKF